MNNLQKSQLEQIVAAYNAISEPQLMWKEANTLVAQGIVGALRVCGISIDDFLKTSNRNYDGFFKEKRVTVNRVRKTIRVDDW